jgi:CheY-like chemotaxis protein
VPSAEEAVLEAAHRPVDLMITDIRLPGISGLELTRRLRLRYKTIKTIQITGMNDPTLEAQAKAAGADYFFLKPLAMPAFIDAVENLLGLKTSQTPETPKSDVGSQPSSQTDRLVELLHSLRMSLGADLTALFDDQGRILFQDIDERFQQKPDPDLVAALAEALHGSNKVSRILAMKDKENVLAFRGRSLDVLVSTVSGGFNLMVVQKNGRTAVRLAIAFDTLLSVRKDVQSILAEMGINLHMDTKDLVGAARPKTRPLKLIDPEPPAQAGAKQAAEEVEPKKEELQAPFMPVNEAGPTPPVVNVPLAAPEPQASMRSAPLAEPSSMPVNIPEEKLEVKPEDKPVAESEANQEPELPSEEPPVDFDDLFNPSAKKKVKAEDANAFWDEAVEKNDSQIATSGLSYEQARKMGLGPEDLPKTK